MGSTADQYQDRPVGDLFCFGIPGYTAYFDFSKQNTTTYTRPKFPYFTVVSLYSCFLVLSAYLVVDVVCLGFLQ